MGRQIEQLAQFVARTRWEDIPEAVQRHAKMTLLDTLGVMLAGAERPEARELSVRIGGTSNETSPFSLRNDASTCTRTR